ncbi:MAG: hypothetical protein JXP37_09770 [Coriobacteriia bacterium]|nr:hypothetical protein [Coriobacteriia bacterium]
MCDRAVFTSHGIYPDLEQPVPGADHYVAVSEEVASHLSMRGYNAAVIRNAIDTDEYCAGPPVSPSLSRVLSLCQGEGAAYQVSVACVRLGIEYRVGGLGISRADDLLAEMHWADCVVGLGRTALEAMSAGRAALILDSRTYMEPATDGMVTWENLDALAAHNFSGRAMRMRPTVNTIISEMECYSPEMGPQNRGLIMERFSVGAAWREYERLAVSQAWSAE